MKGDNIFIIIVIGMLGALLLSAGTLYIYIVYQRRINKQKRAAKRAEMEYQAKLLTATILSQEEERRNIGRELHDEIGSSLALLKLSLCSSQVPSPRTGSNEDNEQIIDSLIAKVRDLSHLLLPPELELFGFHDALAALCDRINRSKEIQLQLNDEALGLIKRKHTKVAFGLYRVFQELLTNTLRHAHASNIEIHLWNEQDALQISYSDNGRGFAYKKGKMDSLGMHNIKSRLLMIGATQHIETSVARGFQIRLRLDHQLLA